MEDHRILDTFHMTDNNYSDHGDESDGFEEENIGTEPDIDDMFHKSMPVCKIPLPDKFNRKEYDTYLSDGKEPLHLRDGINNCIQCHDRCIIHIDIDYFYAQVEELKYRGTSMENRPIGVHQKYLVITSNYAARKCGVKKGMSIKNTKNLCPEIMLINGEDLTPYRDISFDITEYLQLTYQCPVERLGLDENYIDVTDSINNISTDEFADTENIIGRTDETCSCGCHQRLKAAATVAQEIRRGIFKKFGLTTCAGISFNKLLAKIGGSQNKPNNQTVILPSGAVELMNRVGQVRNVTGIGPSSASKLGALGVTTVEELRNAPVELLQAEFPVALATQFKNWSNGLDDSAVIPKGPPQSLSEEDSCHARPLLTQESVKTKLDELAKCLINRIISDGRYPRTIKILVRRNPPAKTHWGRETKQSSLPDTTLSNMSADTENCAQKLSRAAWDLFAKLVDVHAAFSISLLGISVTNLAAAPPVQSRDISLFFTRQSATPASPPAQHSPVAVGKSKPIREAEDEKSQSKSLFIGESGGSERLASEESLHSAEAVKSTEARRLDIPPVSRKKRCSDDMADDDDSKEKKFRDGLLRLQKLDTEWDPPDRDGAGSRLRSPIMFSPRAVSQSPDLFLSPASRCSISNPEETSSVTWPACGGSQSSSENASSGKNSESSTIAAQGLSSGNRSQPSPGSRNSQQSFFRSQPSPVCSNSRPVDPPTPVCLLSQPSPRVLETPTVGYSSGRRPSPHITVGESPCLVDTATSTEASPVSSVTSAAQVQTASQNAGSDAAASLLNRPGSRSSCQSECSSDVPHSVAESPLAVPLPPDSQPTPVGKHPNPSYSDRLSPVLASTASGPERRTASGGLPNKRLFDESSEDISMDLGGSVPAVSSSRDASGADQFIPEEVDRSVFYSLPPDIQSDMLREWKVHASSRGGASTGSSGGGSATTSDRTHPGTKRKLKSVAEKREKHSLLSYFKKM